jgi:phosphate uptake regulator
MFVRMEDDSRSSLIKTLKGEWKLLWEFFTEEEENVPVHEKESLSLEQIHQVTKDLSEDRKLLNQKIEKLNKEIDLHAAKLETLRLLGSEEDNTLKRMLELTDLGQNLGNALQKLDLKLRRTRLQEEELLKQEETV